MDLSTVSAFLGSLKHATELAKVLKESDLSLEKAEVKLQLADLITALADAKIDVANIQQELLDKDEAIRRLEEQLREKANVRYEKPYYWLTDGETKDGPFCQRCYDVDKTLIRLQSAGQNHKQCQACETVYNDSPISMPGLKF